MNEFTAEARDLIKAEDGRKGLVVGNHIFSPHQFNEDIPDFTSRQYIFLNAFRFGVPLEEAAQKADMPPESAERFLDKPKVKAWLADRATKDYIKKEWAEPGKWWQYGDKVLTGEKTLNKGQMVVFQAFGDRVCPKLKDPNDATPKTVIQFNFSAEAVQKAFDRQQSIDAEIVKEQSNGL